MCCWVIFEYLIVSEIKYNDIIRNRGMAEKGWESYISHFNYEIGGKEIDWISCLQSKISNSSLRKYFLQQYPPMFW